MKIGKLLTLMAMPLILTGCGSEKKTEEKHPVKVTVKKVEPISINCRQEYSGTVEEEHCAQLSFTVSGTINRISVVPGQSVAKGALIAIIDDTSIRNAYDMAAAALAQAEDAYNRLQQLHNSNSLPEIEWVEIQSKLRQAQSSEAIARKNLDDCRLYAPFNGVISSKNVEVGQNVMPGMAVVNLVAVDRVKVKISVPENEVATITIGDIVDVAVPALGETVFHGKIVEKGAVANSLSRTYEIKALLDNPGQKIKPGMICSVWVGEDSDSGAIVIPAPVIHLDEKNRTFVWVAAGGKASKCQVNVAGFNSDGAIIESGLTVGDDIIVEGWQKVSENMNVEIVK